MNEYSIFIGIDVSKKWLDVAVFNPESGEISSDQIDNDFDSIKTYASKFTSLGVKALFCLENTGGYSRSFLQVSTLLKLDTWLEHPLQIKRSQGVSRGKTDKLDAVRIADYAYRFQDKAVLWKSDTPTIAQLKELQSKRELLVKTQTQLKQIMEHVSEEHILKPIQTIEESIAQIEQQMDELICLTPCLARQSALLQSIPGVGRVLSVYLLTTTAGFTMLNDPRKLACYAGVAPFPYRSGSSIRYRDRVSKIGNKRLKALLNLSAWNAIRGIPSIKAYYERKLKEGKSKLLVINAIRNKIIAIALAVIKRDTPFSKNYQTNT